MDRIITEKEKEVIINCGAYEYTNEKMAIILDWPLKEIDAMMKSKTSEFFQLYQKGGVMAEYLLNVKIFEMAKSGDLKALEKYEAIKRIKKMTKQ